jgi:DNA-binding transcriptional regulator YdaS (Cro superfamily)
MAKITRGPLRAYRESLGLSPEEFAQLLRIPRPTLRSLENGTRLITAERAMEIEAKTQGALTRIELRPDLFGTLPKQRRRRTEATA